MNFSRKAASSYLDVPRLHFTGQFRADPNTGDNQNCNFDLNNKIITEKNWNAKGTNEFEFIDTVITTVIDKMGNEHMDSELVGAEIFSNENRPLGKIVDLDVDFQVTTLFGLKFGLRHNGVVLFVGNWKPCVIVHEIWEKVKCTEGPFYPAGSIRFGGQSTTKIVDIVWSDSPLISEFKSASKELQVSITLDSYSCGVFTMGRVYGTIGITNSEEPLCVGGERKMVPVDPPGLFDFGKDHPCSKYKQEDEMPWTYDAPFKFDSHRNVLVVDLSNALPTHFSCKDRQTITSHLDIGELHFGYIINDQITPIGESIPYLKSDMWKHSGIVEVPIDENNRTNIQNSKLVVFTELSTADTPKYNPYKIMFHSGTEFTLLLRETEFFVRPMDYYMARLQHSSQLSYSGNSFMKDSHEFTLLVTKFGKPANDTLVALNKSYNQFGDKSNMAYPYDAVRYDDETKHTNELGHVKFNFTLEEKIPLKRHYTKNPQCEPKSLVTEAEISLKDGPYYVLPIDGQVYNFYYCVGDKCELPDNHPFFLYQALISILAFSTYTYDDNYEPTWIDDVKDIFEQQNHISQVMRAILDMSNFTEVTQPHNIELLKYVLSKDSKKAFETDPNYMPTTRNLSPVQRKMILKWLDTPCYNKSCVQPKPISSQIIDYTRCTMHAIPFNSDPQDQDVYLKNIIAKDNLKLLKSDIDMHMDSPPRPLFGLAVVKDKETYPTVFKYFSTNSEKKLCTLESLHKQLQQAVQLEFSTIPLYITSLYSIIQHHNQEAYTAIREVVMQEMLHFVQAANILIATSGKLTIDDPDFVPKYPTRGLPGGVHRHLYVSLENYNLQHLHNTFMIIELPTPHKRKFDNASIMYTVGMFYKEIKECINALGDDIFADSHVNKQVTWPWGGPPKTVGTVYVINDTDSAIKGIDEIIEQGEGANYLDPNQIDTGQYAHYYRFEELVCQKRLVKVDDHHYAFNGTPIIYDKSGVYPIYIPNKNDSKGFLPASDCYTQAKAFHSVYRSLLRVLDKAFNGEPQKITESVELMESLQVHAKRCLSTPYLTFGYNCGLIWDYEWK